MFTIKWNDPYVGLLHTVKFEDGWKRLNKCNAAVYYKRFEYMAGDMECHTDEWYLVSYATPVCKIVRYVNDTLGHIGGYDVEIDSSFSGWSVSSKRQLHKLLDNLRFFENVNVNYYDVIESLREMEKDGSKSKEVNDGETYVFGCTEKHVKQVFDLNTPKYALSIQW